MSIFGSIRDAIFGRAQAAPAQPQPQAQRPAAMPQMQQQQPAAAGGPGLAGASAQTVDVDAVLASAAAQKGQQLNYQSSIVDLMKLLDLDPSLDNRKQLATELGYAGAKDGSAEMNIWLHRKVMDELEKNGGRVSASLRA
ncbi:MAG: hypothetical protein QOI38_2789 [Sphingomonadales bacterium]|jgi:hypothetical protein|nr:hypothetical protein [Sphingomonadales bacterium]